MEEGSGGFFKENKASVRKYFTRMVNIAPENPLYIWNSRFVEDRTTWEIYRQFLWGPALLISPVLDQVRAQNIGKIWEGKRNKQGNIGN